MDGRIGANRQPVTVRLAYRLPMDFLKHQDTLHHFFLSSFPEFRPNNFVLILRKMFVQNWLGAVSIFTLGSAWVIWINCNAKFRFRFGHSLKDSGCFIMIAAWKPLSWTMQIHWDLTRVKGNLLGLALNYVTVLSWGLSRILTRFKLDSWDFLKNSNCLDSWQGKRLLNLL